MKNRGMEESNRPLFKARKRALAAAVSVPLACAVLGTGSVYAASDDAVAIEEILVTARKTSESLQEVPIAINVMSGDFLENARLDDVQDVLIRVPGVGFGQPFKSYTPIAIRGASTQDDSIGVDPNVSIFIDEVYVGSTTSIEFDLLDLQRVEVLKGPQGTLFGRNTNGGVIHYVTRDPDGEFRAGVNFTYGNDERIEVAGTVSGQVADSVYGSLSMRTRNTGGYQRNLVTGNNLGQEKVSGGRAKLRFAPGEDLDIVLSADVMVDNSFGVPRDFVGDNPDLIDGPFTNKLNESMQDLDGNYERLGWGVSAKVRYETGLGTFHSITALRDFDGKLHDFDFDAVNGRTSDGSDTTEAFPFQQTTLKSFSQEFRLDWDAGDAVNGTTGLYYLNEEQFRIEHLAASGVPGSWFYEGDFPRDILSQEVDTTSFAVFTDIRFNLTESVTLSLGGRWSRDKKDGETVCAQVGRFFCAAVYSTDYNETWSEPSYRAVVDFQLRDDIMAYVSYARGYKSGGFSNSASGDGPLEVVAPLLATPYEPEFSDSYEAGLRMQFMGRRITLNPTLFYVEYTDVQFLFLDGNSFISGNIGEAENQGIETDFNFAVTDTFNVWASYAYQDSEYTGGASFGVPILGNQLQLTPEHSFTMGFTYDHELANGGAITLSGDMVQKSRQYDDATNAEDASTVFKDIYNLRLAYKPTDKLEIALWVNNLTDKRNRVGTNSDPFFDGLVFSEAEVNAGKRGLWVTHTPPRTFGATLRLEF